MWKEAKFPYGKSISLIIVFHVYQDFLKDYLTPATQSSRLLMSKILNQWSFHLFVPGLYIVISLTGIGLDVVLKEEFENSFALLEILPSDSTTIQQGLQIQRGEGIEGEFDTNYQLSFVLKPKRGLQTFFYPGIQIVKSSKKVTRKQ